MRIWLARYTQQCRVGVESSYWQTACTANDDLALVYLKNIRCFLQKPSDVCGTGGAYVESTSISERYIPSPGDIIYSNAQKLSPECDNQSRRRH